MTGLELRRALESIRAYGFGGLVGTGMGIILYYRFHVNLGLPPYLFITVSGLLGATCQQAIQGVLNFVFGPVFRFLAFHEKLFELEILAHRGIISQEKLQELVDKLCEKRFLE